MRWWYKIASTAIFRNFLRFVIRLTRRPGLQALWLGVLFFLLIGWAGVALRFLLQSHGFSRELLRDPALFPVLFHDLFQILRSLVPGTERTAGEGGWELNVLHGLGLAIFLWGAAPPILAALVRSLEHLIARFLFCHHYVVLGLGQAGSALLESLVDASRKHLVIGVDVAADGSDFDRARAKGAVVLAADAAGAGLIESLAVHRAAGIFVATGEESRNLEIAGRLAARIERKLGLTAHSGPSDKWPQVVPQVVPHVNDPILRLRQSREEGLLSASQDGTGQKRIRPVPFSSDETAVRLLFESAAYRTQETLGGYARLLGAPRVHAVVLGFDSIAESIVRETLQAGLSPDLAPPRVTVIVDNEGTRDGDDPGSAISSLFFQRYPQLHGFKDKRIRFRSFNFRQLDHSIFDLTEDSSLLQKHKDATPLVRSCAMNATVLKWLDDPNFLPADKVPQLERDGVTAVFICLGDDDRNLSVAIALQSLVDKTRRWGAPTFLRLRADTGLERVLRSPDHERRLEKVIHDFGQDRLVCSHEQIFGRPELAAARAAHASYLLTDYAIGYLKRMRKWKSAGGQEPKNALEELTMDASPQDIEDWWVRQKEEEGRPAEPRNAQHDLKRWRNLILKYVTSRLAQAEHARTTLASNDDIRESRSPSTMISPRYQQRGDQPWQNLVLKYVGSSLAQAEHARVKLVGLGYQSRADQGDEVHRTRRASRWFMPRRRSEGAQSRTAVRGPRWVRLSAREPSRDDEGDEIPQFHRESENAEGRPAVHAPLTFVKRIDELRPPADRKKGNQECPIAALAVVEHMRFVVERHIGGTSFGIERDNQHALHPDLVPFEALSEDSKARDHGAALLAPYIARHLRPASIWWPELRLGLVGAISEFLLDAPAVDERMEATRTEVERAIRHYLRAQLLPALQKAFAAAHGKWIGGAPITNGANDVAMTIFSSLAPGADLILAEAGCEQAGLIGPARRPAPARLVVPKPVTFGPDFQDVDDPASDDAMADSLRSLTHAGIKKAAIKNYRHRRTNLISAVDSSAVWEVDLMPQNVADRFARADANGLRWQVGEAPKLDDVLLGVPATESLRRADGDCDDAKKVQDVIKKRRRTFRSGQMKCAAAYVRAHSDWLVVVRAADGAAGVTDDDQARNQVLEDATWEDFLPYPHAKRPPAVAEAGRPRIDWTALCSAVPRRQDLSVLQVKHCPDRCMTVIEVAAASVRQASQERGSRATTI